jgi:hypothetical protein
VNHGGNGCEVDNYIKTVKIRSSFENILITKNKSAEVKILSEEGKVTVITMAFLFGLLLLVSVSYLAAFILTAAGQAAYDGAVDSTFVPVENESYTVTQLKTGVENYHSADETVYLQVYYDDSGQEKMLSNGPGSHNEIGTQILPRGSRTTYVQHVGTTSVMDSATREYINPQDEYILYMAMEDIPLQPYEVKEINDGGFTQTERTYYPLW